MTAALIQVLIGGVLQGGMYALGAFGLGTALVAAAGVAHVMLYSITPMVGSYELFRGECVYLRRVICDRTTFSVGLVGGHRIHPRIRGGAQHAAVSSAESLLRGGLLKPSTVFGLEIALVPIVMAMLGGVGHVWGPVLGAYCLTLIEELLWTQMPYLHLTTYGVILLLVGFYLPGGLVRLR